MLGDAEDSTSAFSKFPIHFPVALTVPGDLGLPELTVALGRTVAPRTAVPKASVDKDREALFSEREVRLAGKFQMPPPPRNTLLSEDLHHHPFRPLVALAPDP